MIEFEFERLEFREPIPSQKGYQDYLEGRGRLGEAGEIDHSTETVIIGQQLVLAPYKTSGRYQGRILHPERRREEWSFQANMLFFAGVITARRSVFLIPSPSRDPHYASGGIIYPETFTTDELLWLRDNHYTFESNFQDGLNPTTKVQGILATPPPVLARTRAPIPILRNYQIDKTLSKPLQDRTLKTKLQELMGIKILNDSIDSTQHSVTRFFTEFFNKIEAVLEDEEDFVKKFAVPSPDRTPPRPEIGKKPIPYDSPATAAALEGLKLAEDKATHRERRRLSLFENGENSGALSPDPKRRRTSGGSSRLLGGRSSRFIGGGSPRLLTERPDGTTPPPTKVPTILMSLSSIEQQ